MNARIWAATGLLTAFGAVVASAAPRPAAPARKARRAATVAAAPRARTRAMTPPEARTAVAMLDDAYHLILEETHAAYHTQPTRPVAASVVRKLQARMAELGWPRARFLAVNAVVMHPDHLPRDDFERRAVQTLRGNDERVEQVVDGQLRVATVVSTGGSCFSCHWTSPGKASKAAITFAVPLR
jgi:hypothetical protein